MGAFFKYLFLFLFFGIAWFLIFSIPISKTSNLFLVMQKELKMTPETEEEGGNKKNIDREKVIDALTKAFESK